MTNPTSFYSIDAILGLSLGREPDPRDNCHKGPEQGVVQCRATDFFNQLSYDNSREDLVRPKKLAVTSHKSNHDGKVFLVIYLCTYLIIHRKLHFVDRTEIMLCIHVVSFMQRVVIILSEIHQLCSYFVI